MSLNPEISESTKFSEQQLAEYVIKATRGGVLHHGDDGRPRYEFPLKDPITHFRCSITGMVGLCRYLFRCHLDALSDHVGKENYCCHAWHGSG